MSKMTDDPHFTPHAPEPPPICGMTVDCKTDGTWLRIKAGTSNREAAIRLESLADKYPGIIGTAIRDWCAAHRLAQPAPVVDPDAVAKRLSYEYERAKNVGWQGYDCHTLWKAIDEDAKNGWRAVAAAKGAGE